MRQIRRQSKKCDLSNKDLSSQISQCYDRSFKESRDSYGPNNTFVWSANEKEGDLYWGAFHAYPKGGFVEILSHNMSESLITVMSLEVIPLLSVGLAFVQENKWIDRSTGAILISFTLYNANINRLGVVRLAFEFLPSGLVVT